MAYAPSCYNVHDANNGSGLSFMDMWYLWTESDIATDWRGYSRAKPVESGRNPLVVEERYQELYRVCSVGYGDYCHVRTGGRPTFRLYWCVHPYGGGEPEGEEENYFVGNYSRIAVECYWWRWIYYLVAYCRHAVSMGGTSSDCGDCDGLCLRCLRI